MLDAEYLANLPDDIVEIWETVEEEILCDLAKRIRQHNYLVPSSEWKLSVLSSLGAHQNYVIECLSKATAKSEKEIKRILPKAFTRGLKNDLEIIRKGKHLGSINDININTEALNLIANKGIKMLNDNIRNFTKTYAATISQKYEWTIDKVYLNIQSGYISQDIAITNAINELFLENDLPDLVTRNGRHEQIGTVIRRAVITGTNQAMSKMQIANCEELGCDLVEVSSHYGARPSHAEWQGGIFSLSGESKKYPDFVRSTGYGSIDGLCGVNCRHSFYPFFEGLSAKSFNKIRRLNNDEKLEEKDKERKARYRIKRLERQIEFLKAGGADTTKWKAKLSKAKKELRQVLKENAGKTLVTDHLKNLWDKIEPNFQEIKKDLTGITKEDKTLWNRLLRKVGFPPKMTLCKSPKKLKEIREDIDRIYIKRSDLAYVFFRHYGQIEYNEFLKMPKIIQDYDLMTSANRPGQKGSYLFYKMYGDVGFEIVVEESEKSKEFLVHYVKHGRRKKKGSVKYQNIIKTRKMIDKKK